MKNSRKQQQMTQAAGDTAHGTAQPHEPLQENTDFFTHPVFNQKPEPRRPENIEEEVFRHFLKSNLPRVQASADVQERIKRIYREEK